MCAKFLDSWRAGGTGQGPYILISRTTGEIPLIARGVAGQTANIFEVENSAGTNLFTVDPSGNVSIAGSITAVVSETVTGNITLTGNLVVNGNTTLGDVAGDTLTVNATTTFANPVTLSSTLAVTGQSIFSSFISAPTLNLVRRGATPATIGATGRLYTFAGDADTTELWYLDAAGNAVQITDAGALDGAGVHWDDDEAATWGNTPAAPNVQLLWETADANANELLLVLPTGGAVDVPVFVIGDESALNVDLGFFNGETAPAVAVLNATQASYLSMSHDGTNGRFVLSNAGSVAFVRPGPAVIQSQIGMFAGGTTVFNENGIDVDFRVESDNVTNIINVDAALDVVSFGGAGVDNQFITITERTETSGTPSALVITGAAHTGITAATEAIGINLNQSATKTWAAGAGPLATQREIVFQAPTYVGNAGGALTITNATTVYISDAPTAGANMTISNSYALFVDAGITRLDDLIRFGADGTALTAGNHEIGRVVTGLSYNVPTGDIHIFSINNVESFRGTTSGGFGSLTLIDDKRLVFGSDSDWLAFSSTAFTIDWLENAVAAFKWSGAAIANFAAAADTAGNSIFWEFQGGGTSTGVGRTAGAWTITMGAGSAAAGASGLAGGNGGDFILEGGAPGAGDGAGNDGEATIVYFGQVGTGVGGVSITQRAKNEGSPSVGAFAVTGGAHTDLANSIFTDTSFSFSNTANFVGGGAAISTLSVIGVRSRTYSADAAQTITNSIVLSIDNVNDVAGANVTLTNSYGIQVGGAAAIGATSASMTYGLIDIPAHTVTVTGSTQVTSSPGIAGVRIGIVTVTDAAAVTIDSGASLCIAGAVTAAGSVTLTAPLSLWLDAGRARFDDHLVFGAGVAVVGADYMIGRDADGTNQLHLNVPTGATMEFSVNDAAVWTSGASVITTTANTDINMSAGGRLYGGGMQINSQTLAADTNLTMDENDGHVVITTGAVSVNTVTLPAASGNEGMVVSFYVTTDGGQNANIVRAGADVIQNGSADLGNTQVALDDAGDYLMLECVSSTMWQVVVNNGGTVT